VSESPIDAIPAQRAELAGLPIRRLLPRSRRRMVGPWCFLDAFGPISFGSGRPMDVAPHPHIGLQTVSWLLDGEVLHDDSLGATGLARPGVLNLMTAGRGIAHSERTPRDQGGRLHGVQLWVALPDGHRNVEPAFEQHCDLPLVELPGGLATLFLGELAGERSPATAFSALVGAELRVGRTLKLPLQPRFEHALLLLDGSAALAGAALVPDTLYYLPPGRSGLELRGSARLLLIGGPPFGETILMWWNFVARTPGEIAEARADWEAGRRFGEVRAYPDRRIPAPPLPARPVAG
jgi:redox-sensitive bicupin YhaK (pirin superfamily)